MGMRWITLRESEFLSIGIYKFVSVELFEGGNFDTYISFLKGPSTVRPRYSACVGVNFDNLTLT